MFGNDFIATLDHVAIAVRDISVALRFYGDTLGARFVFAGDQPDQGFRFAQFRFPGGGKVEFVTPLGPDSFLTRFIEQRGEGPHHLTLKVPDIHEAIESVRASGVEPIRIAIENPEWKEAFIHPRDASGTLVQLAQAALDDEEIVRHHLAFLDGKAHEDREHRHLSLEQILQGVQPGSLDTP